MGAAYIAFRRDVKEALERCEREHGQQKRTEALRASQEDDQDVQAIRQRMETVSTQMQECLSRDSVDLEQTVRQNLETLFAYCMWALQEWGVASCHQKTFYSHRCVFFSTCTHKKNQALNHIMVPEKTHLDFTCFPLCLLAGFWRRIDQANEALSVLASRMEVDEDWRLIARESGLVDQLQAYLLRALHKAPSGEDKASSDGASAKTESGSGPAWDALASACINDSVAEKVAAEKLFPAITLLFKSDIAVDATLDKALRLVEVLTATKAARIAVGSALARDYSASVSLASLLAPASSLSLASTAALLGTLVNCCLDPPFRRTFSAILTDESTTVGEGVLTALGGCLRSQYRTIRQRASSLIGNIAQVRPRGPGKKEKQLSFGWSSMHLPKSIRL